MIVEGIKSQPDADAYLKVFGNSGVKLLNAST